MGKTDKSKHVGNHGGAYTDNDGMRRQFTYIDHDKKPTIASGKLEKGELEKIKRQLVDYKQSLIKRILGLPASICPWEFDDYVIRNENTPVILWNEVMLRDEGMSTDKLSQLCILLERRFELI